MGLKKVEALTSSRSGNLHQRFVGSENLAEAKNTAFYPSGLRHGGISRRRVKS